MIALLKEKLGCAVTRTLALMAAALVCLPALGNAQGVAPINSGNTAWMLTSAVLVLFMTLPGLALFYGGLVRKKNVVNTLMQCVAICCIVTVLWVVVGYSMAFTPGTSDFFGGFGKTMLAGIGKDSMTGDIPEMVFVMFQLTFAIITPALIIGAIVERIKFTTLMIFMGAWLLVVYCPVAYMVWGGGLMAKMGVIDFAGGTVVHLNAGVAALVACILLGKRKDFGKSDILKPSNIGYAMIGASMLWVGWFGFNAGSALAANGQAGMAMMNTHLAAAVATLAWVGTEWMMKGKPTLVGASCGIVAGLVCVTPAAGFVAPSGALVIGLAGGVLCYLACTLMKDAFGYDDSLDVVGVHGVGGVLGVVLTGVFAVEAVGGKTGLLEGNMDQLIAQLKGVAITAAWSGVATAAILLGLSKTIGLRVKPKEESDGLDLAVHGERESQ